MLPRDDNAENREFASRHRSARAALSHVRSNPCGSAVTWNPPAGTLQESLKQYDEAFRHYTMAIELRPTFFYTYVRRGRIYSRMKNNNMALLDFNHSIAIDSTHYAAYYERGVVYQNIGEYEKSIEDYE